MTTENEGNSRKTRSMRWRHSHLTRKSTERHGRLGGIRYHLAISKQVLLGSLAEKSSAFYQASVRMDENHFEAWQNGDST